MGNEKKIDNKIAKNDNLDLFNEPEPMVDELLDTELFEEDKLQFDDDGNIIGLDDDNTPTDGTGEPEIVEPEDKQTQPTEEVQEVKSDNIKEKANKSPTPADIKVINLKKENKALQQQLNDVLKAQQALALEQEKENLRKDYVVQGYDEDTAKTMSANEIRLRQLEEQLNVATFREENSDILALYPEAKANIGSIMRNAKLTGMTVEQICKGLYGTPTINENDRRAIQAVKGQSTREVVDNKTNIIPTATADTTVLTRAQQTEKAYLERLNHGKLTMEEYKKYSRL